MGKHARPRINFALSHKSKEVLEEWAKNETRTLSNLVESIVEEALREHNTTSRKEDKSQSFDATSLLRRILEPLSDTDIILLSSDYDLDPKLLLEIRDRIQQSNH